MRWPMLIRLLLPALLLWLLPHASAGQDLRLFTEFEYRNGDIEITDKETGTTRETSLEEFNQRYNLQLQRRIYPHLSLLAGGTLEYGLTDTTTDSVDSDRRRRILRPFAEMTLGSPFRMVGAGYRRTQIRDALTGTETTELFRYDADIFLRWRPVELPEFNLRYNRVHTRNEPKTLDTMQDLINFNTLYAWQGLRGRYTYIRDETEDRLQETEALRQLHEGRIEYFRRFLHGRADLDTSYRIIYDRSESDQVAVLASGLVGFDLAADDGPLAPEPRLTDGDRATPVPGLDLVRTGATALQSLHLGLDLGLSFRIDQLHVYVAPSQLTAADATAFNWQVLVSEDNTESSVWGLMGVGTVTYDELQRRFVIPIFPSVDTRFVKVVTTPLEPTDPRLPSGLAVQVTELEAITVLAGEEPSTIRRTGHYYNLGLRARFTDRTDGSYGFSWFRDQTRPFDRERTSWTHSVNFGHRFTRAVHGSVRAHRTDTRETTRADQVSYGYGAALRANWLPTFSQSLIFNGSYDIRENGTEQLDDGSSTTNTLMLRNVLRLYRGVDFFADGGYSLIREFDGRKTGNTLVRLGTDLRPNPRFTLTANYSARFTEVLREADEPDLQRVSTQQQWDMQAYYTPVRALSLFAGLTIRESRGDTRYLRNFIINWSPFPDAPLQLILPYNEIHRSEENRTDRIFDPTIRWTISRSLFLDLSYTVFESESDVQDISSRTLRAVLRAVI